MKNHNDLSQNKFIWKRIQCFKLKLRRRRIHLSSRLQCRSVEWQWTDGWMVHRGDGKGRIPLNLAFQHVIRLVLNSLVNSHLERLWIKSPTCDGLLTANGKLTSWDLQCTVQWDKRALHYCGFFFWCFTSEPENENVFSSPCDPSTAFLRSAVEFHLTPL